MDRAGQLDFNGRLVKITGNSEIHLEFHGLIQKVVVVVGGVVKGPSNAKSLTGDGWCRWSEVGVYE